MAWWHILPNNSEILRRSKTAFSMSFGNNRLVMAGDNASFFVDIPRGHQNYVDNIKNSFGGKLSAQRSSYAEVQKILAVDHQTLPEEIQEMDNPIAVIADMIVKRYLVSGWSDRNLDRCRGWLVSNGYECEDALNVSFIEGANGFFAYVAGHQEAEFRRRIRRHSCLFHEFSPRDHLAGILISGVMNQVEEAIGQLASASTIQEEEPEMTNAIEAQEDHRANQDSLSDTMVRAGSEDALASLTVERFAEMASRMNQKEIAYELGVGTWKLRQWQKHTPGAERISYTYRCDVQGCVNPGPFTNYQQKANHDRFFHTVAVIPTTTSDEARLEPTAPLTPPQPFPPQTTDDNPFLQLQERHSFLQNEISRLRRELETTESTLHEFEQRIKDMLAQ